MTTSEQEELGPVEIQVNVSWPTGSETVPVKCPREEWNAMTPAERTRWCDEAARVEAENMVGWGWDVLGRDMEGLE